MEKKHIFDDPRNVKRLLGVFFVVCAALAAIDLIFHRHVIHAWEALPFFYAIFGFVACAALVLIAKEMRKVLMRKKDYYER
ncbi:MAG: hypothetical protein ACE5H8_06460 [Alphaproteobacteria bacterium]